MTQRPIKFRAWDNAHSRFFAPTYEAYKGILEDLHISLSGDLCIRSAYKFTHQSMFPHRFILEQFIGLLDKNGKEIYEGDIVAYYEFLPNETWDGGKVVIAWDEKNARFTTPLTEAAFNVPPESVKIMGNIHENPDLIESDTKQKDA